MKEHCFDDCAMMTDALDSQKMIAQQYNHYAGECSTQQKKNKLLHHYASCSFILSSLLSVYQGFVKTILTKFAIMYCSFFCFS